MRCGTFRFACGKCYDTGKYRPHENNDPDCKQPKIVGRGTRTICCCPLVPCPNGCLPK